MPEEFNETTDLYLALLRRAQEVEDPRLVSMILERLKPLPGYPAAADPGCVVIPFPVRPARPESGAEDACFWPRMAPAQICAIVMIYGVLVIGHFLFA